MAIVKVLGLQALKRALATAPKKTRSETDIAIKKSIRVIERESKKVSPVDTGRMRASITDGILFKSLYGEIGPTTKYAIYVHEGTRYVTSRPFMRWGFEAAVPNIRSAGFSLPVS